MRQGSGNSPPPPPPENKTPLENHGNQGYFNSGYFITILHTNWGKLSSPPPLESISPDAGHMSVFKNRIKYNPDITMARENDRDNQKYW